MYLSSQLGMSSHVRTFKFPLSFRCLGSDIYNVLIDQSSLYLSLFIFMYIGIFPALVSVYHMCALPTEA